MATIPASRMRSLGRAIRATVLVSTVVLGGCATGGIHVPGDGVRVNVDDVFVDVSSRSTVLDVLKRGTFAGRLTAASPLDRAPLVVVDGIYRIDGLSALAYLPALEVESVRTMRRLRAVALYGPLADGGAIVVRTRRGRP